MEEQILQSLGDIGYDGLIDAGKLSQMLENGPKSVDFTKLVAWLAEQLNLFGCIDEHIHAITTPNDSSTFLLELSSFLKELGCVNSQLVFGNVNQRLSTKQERILLLEYLLAELMAYKIIKAKNPEAEKLQLTIHESDTARNLKQMLIALQLGKPPDNITMEQLFNKLEGKLKTAISSAPPDLLGKPLIMGELSNAQWEKLNTLQNEMKEEYKIRREMLLKRLDVTVQSFLWSERIRLKEDQLNSCYRTKRNLLTPDPDVTISQLLAVRDDLLVIEKTSSAGVRKNTNTNVMKVIIGDVPDRGGRAHEQAPPPPEMPSWQKDRQPDTRGGGRGGGGGRESGGGRGGGGRGGYHKDVNTNFGQNRDWKNVQGGGSYQDNRGGNYNQNWQGASQGGSYQDNRGGNYGQNRDWENSSRGSSYQDNRDYQRGGPGGGGSGRGYNRGRGGRVQGGWAQGNNTGYSRGGNRSHY